jgi:hypothetical protein
MQNQAPVYYQNLMRSTGETVWRGLAAEFGCDTEELAITRNASESLQIPRAHRPGRRRCHDRQTIPDADDRTSAVARQIKAARLQFPVPTTFDDRPDGSSAITSQTKVLHFTLSRTFTASFPRGTDLRMARAASDDQTARMPARSSRSSSTSSSAMATA